MSTEPSQSVSEELAAYLDGELSHDETQALERRLATDPALLKELGQLQKSWDLLDALPRGKADENFSTTTMSLAVEQLKREAASQQPSWFSTRWASIVGGLLLAIVVCGVGYAVVDRIAQAPKLAIERDLHLLSNYVTYSRLSENYLGERNLEFLKLLQSSGLFVSSEGVDLQAHVEPTKLESLTAEERADVLHHYQDMKVNAAGDNRKKIDSMNSLAKQIGADSSRIDLLRTYDRYYHWLQSLPPRKILDIEEEKDPARRLELIRLQKQQQNQERFDFILKSENLRGLLTREDYKVYVDWLVEFITAHEQEILQGVAVDNSVLKRIEKITEQRRRLLTLYGLYVQKVGENNAIVPSQTDYGNLTSRLSEEARKEFSAVELDEQQRRRMLRALASRRLVASKLQSASERADLTDIRNTLSREEQEKLERLSKTELSRKLKELYEKRNEKKNPERKPNEKKDDTESKNPEPKNSEPKKE